MGTSLEVISNEIRSVKAINRVAMALGHNAETEDGKNEARKYAASVLAEIERSEGAEFGDLTVCSTPSIVQAMIDAATFRVKLDGRKMAHMEVRYNKHRKCQEAILQIDTNGFVAKIAEAYPDVDYSTVTVFEGDECEIIDNGDVQYYTLKRKNAFCSDVSKLSGVIVKISYTDNGRLIQRVDTVSASDLKAMMAMGKGNAWKSWTIERMRTAALKRCCKWHFRKLSLLQDMIEYDNRQSYDLNAPAPSITPSAGTVIDNLNKAMEEDKPKIVDAEQVEVKEPEAPICGTCGGKGVIETADGKEPCPTCSAQKKPTDMMIGG